MSRALIRGMSQEDEGQFVGYFLPNEETLRKRKKDADEEADQLYDYNLAHLADEEERQQGPRREPPLRPLRRLQQRPLRRLYYNDLGTELCVGKSRRPNVMAGNGDFKGSQAFKLL